MATPATFSESWHRVAGLRLALRPAVQMHKQIYRGETWYVIHDPFTNEFFRVRPEARAFIARLTPERTVAEVWQQCLELDPDGAPGQEEVIALLAQLHHAGLLHYQTPAPESHTLFQRYRRMQQRRLRSRLANVMFVRLPLFDPDGLLDGLRPLLGLVFGPASGVLWLAAAVLAVKTVLDNPAQLLQEAGDLLVPANLPLFYLGLVLVKVWHECGHAAACKRFGGEVHTLGVMLLVFTPLPYMDATASWAFRRRRQRLLVASAGMIFELFAASLAALVWGHTGDGAVHRLAANMMVVASVSTVLFNANPLLRYDGYYILSDLLGIPNLHGRAFAHLRALVESKLFGCRQVESPATTRREALWLTIFGVSSAVYRVMVCIAIILFVANRYLIVGVLMALVCTVLWGIVPLGRFLVYLAGSPRLARNRWRAVAVTLGGATLLFTLAGALPARRGLEAPGVVASTRFLRVVNETAGTVEELLVPSGETVDKGTPLVRLSNPELAFDIAAAMAQREEVLAQLLQASHERNADLEPLNKRLAAIDQHLQRLQTRKEALTVRAHADGLWISPRGNQLAGVWLKRGSQLGVLLDPHAYRFTAVITQEEAATLFANRVGAAQVRLAGEAATPVPVTHWQIIPYQQERLPSAALGRRGGGALPVAETDESGRTSAEPFFEVRATLEPGAPVTLLHGRSGRLRVALPPQPLLEQWSRRLRQLVQKRYQL